MPRRSFIGVIRKNLNGRVLEGQLIDSNGRTGKICREPITVEQKDYVKPIEFNPQELERGTYTAVFSANGEYFTRTEFEIIE